MFNWNLKSIAPRCKTILRLTVTDKNHKGCAVYKCSLASLSQCPSTRKWLTGFGVAFRVEHDLGSTVPSCGHILCQKPCVVMIRVSYSSQTKITNLEQKLLYPFTRISLCYLARANKNEKHYKKFGMVNKQLHFKCAWLK